MSGIERLVAIMKRLRGPGGCPWDREQTLESLSTYLLEETYEVIDAIASGSLPALREELGDLLVQIVFQTQIANERGAFDLEGVAHGIAEKIVRRHPHVFADARVSTSGQVLAQWEQIKVEERRHRADGSLFAGVPAALPALLKALRLSTKASRVGFDWPDLPELLAKVREELGELERALRRRGEAARRAVAEELGDLLFTLANVARQQDLDPEEALQAANRKFMARFRYVEDRLRERGLRTAPEHRVRMEALWREAKRALRKTSPARSAPSAGTSGSGVRRARRAKARAAPRGRS
ncbi:MAG: nucleoside triphosphate pyrophosphohydrolase [Candidatus Polarisedimenticolia bacterium]